MLTTWRAFLQYPDTRAAPAAVIFVHFYSFLSREYWRKCHLWLIAARMATA
jgi:hypothetical protein